MEIYSCVFVKNAAIGTVLAAFFYVNAAKTWPITAFFYVNAAIDLHLSFPLN